MTTSPAAGQDEPRRTAPGQEQPRRRFLDRLTEPIADRAREKIDHAEDRVRATIQSEIDAVSASVRTRAIQIRPSAILFGSSALLAFFGLALFVVAGVVGLAHAVPLWLSALLVGAGLVLVAAALAAWGKRRLPEGPSFSVVRARQPEHPAEELVHPWAD
ncbi:phage holin family protein [Cellulomonas massiliensis]|uniref:phage holin family protein n=1 Tax=Cellulomonas massiliensis TaxID=1465811 RepID=UPI0002FAD75D|nr:phage holin family protein [Cellulomonas massiliensis]